MRCRCYRCQLRPGEFLEFEADRLACPKCGAGEAVVIELADVHWLMPDPAGPHEGSDGVRRAVGCDRKRDVLALGTLDHFAASPDPRAVTCPRCQGLEAWRQAAALFREMRGVLAGLKGCCG